VRVVPKWLSSILIVIGFIALVVLAFLPRNLEVTVTTNVHDEMTANDNGQSESINDSEGGN
jgi:hypothetical protein